MRPAIPRPYTRLLNLPTYFVPEQAKHTAFRRLFDGGQVPLQKSRRRPVQDLLQPRITR